MNQTPSQTTSLAPLKYKIGDCCATGQKIVMILGHSDSVCVYLTDDNNMRWEYLANSNRLPKNLIPTVSIFDSLMVRVKLMITDKQKPGVYHRLGKALFSALDDGKPNSAAAYFQPVEKHIQEQSLHQARYTYVLAGIVSGAALIAIIGLAWIATKLWIPTDVQIQNSIFLSSILGIAGSWISILGRSAQLNVDPTSGSKFLILQGFARVVLGVLFALFSFMACKADLIFGIFANNEYALCAIGFVAGFSERLVPEAMRKIESGQVDTEVQVIPKNADEER